MNSNNKIIVCVSIIVALVILSFFYINRKIEDTLEVNRKETNILLSRVAHYIDVSNEIVSKEQIHSFKLSETNVLIYRFSEEMCDGCILQDLKELYNIQKNIGKNKVLVLPAYENTHYNTMLLKDKLSNFRFLNIPEDSLKFPINHTTGLYQRFFAYVNNKGEMTSFYFPSKNQQDMTRFYLSYLKEKIKKP